jgi:hypothetical protein
MAPKKVFMLFALLYTLFPFRENTIPARLLECAWLPAPSRARACGARFIEGIVLVMRAAHLQQDAFYVGRGGAAQGRDDAVWHRYKQAMMALPKVSYAPQGSSKQNFFRV